MTSQPNKINIPSKLEGLKFYTGDYIRWPTQTIVFAADDKGYVEPLEVEYAYGIIVAVASGTDISSDAVIVRSTTLDEWIVAHIDDPDFKFELLSRAHAGRSND